LASGAVVKRLVLLGLSGWLLVGCHASSPSSSFVQVRITDVTVGLVKTDGRPWDDVGVVSARDIADLSSALGAPDAAIAVTNFLARPALEGIDKPDVLGSATLFLGAAPPAKREFKGQPNSQKPSLDPAPVWRNVPLDDSTRIEVTLFDEDLVNDDALGTFVIQAADLAAAAESGVVHQLQVAKQTGNSVLFVGLLVVPDP